jgi:outer membrane protein assembly factor BamE (lipoprotein component of BamABCDE complex)
MLLRLGFSLIVCMMIAADGTRDGEVPRKDAARAEKPDAPSKVTDENYKKIGAGMSEAQVLAVFGPPLKVIDRSPQLKGLVWEDRNGIKVRYRDGKAVALEAKFSKHIKSKSVNESNYKALKRGMTRAEIEKILAGFPCQFGMFEDGFEVVDYVHFREIEVQIRDGKVTGTAFMRSEEKGAPTAGAP